MKLELATILLAFSAIGYGGAGAALAAARSRAAESRERDLGMLGVATLLVGFAMLCSAVLGGLAAVLAVGGPVLVSSYIFAAERLGLFRVQSGPLGEVPAEESRRTG